MKIAVINTFDIKNVRNWSGIPFHISIFLDSVFSENIDYIQIPKLRRTIKSLLLGFYYNRIKRKRYYTWADKDYIVDNRDFVQKSLVKNYDLIITFDFYLVPLLKKADNKIIYWNDANFSNLYGFYTGYSNFSQYSFDSAHFIQKQALELSNKIIYSSDWAIETAISLYNINKNKFNRISFASNFTYSIEKSDIATFIEKRNSKTIKLLFLGADWIRKGGNDAVAVVNSLNSKGVSCKLCIVGTEIPLEHQGNSNLVPYGFVDKSSPDGETRLVDLFKECAFLILPSRIDLTPVVFSEASSFALPTITTNIGGITSVIERNVNGIYYEVSDFVENASNYILNNQPGTPNYTNLCYSSFSYYQDNLSWNQVKRKFLSIMNDLAIE